MWVEQSEEVKEWGEDGGRTGAKQGLERGINHSIRLSILLLWTLICLSRSTWISQEIAGAGPNRPILVLEPDIS